MKIKSWVENSVADSIIEAFRRDGDTKSVRNLMDAIVCVKNYNLNNLSKQGVIRSFLSKDKIRNNESTAIMYSSDIRDIVSIFWESVFKNIDKAKLTSEQTGNICNPVYFLRKCGIISIRNYLNKEYRKYIRQVCSDCGNKSCVSYKENNANCPKCQSSNTMVNSSPTYGKIKERTCLECKNVWSRKFVKSCRRCNSHNIYTDVNIIHDDDLYKQISVDNNLDALICNMQDADNMSIITNSILEDLEDRSLGRQNTKMLRIFKILTNEEFSKDMCRLCKLNNSASGKTCQFDHFNDKCINYTKRMSDYFNCAESVVSKKVKKIRAVAKQNIIDNKDKCIYKSIYDTMRNKKML